MIEPVQFDEDGEAVFHIDYTERGLYGLFLLEGDEVPVRRARSVSKLVDDIAKFPGDPQAAMSQSVEILYSLEATEGQSTWWEEGFGEPNRYSDR